MDIVVIGGGGFAKEVIQYVLDGIEAGRIDGALSGVLSRDRPEPDILDRVPWLGLEGDHAFTPGQRAILALGDGRLRLRIAAGLEAAGVEFLTLVHPTAYVAPTAVLGPGCVLAPFAFVGPMAQLGRHVVLNTYASIGHDAQAGAGTTLSPYACINGGARLGEGVFLGSQAVVTPGVSVGDISKVAAGATVTSDAPAGSLLVGNPARGRVMFR